MPPTIDLLTPVQAIQTQRTLHPQQNYTKSTLEHLKCNNLTAFTTPQPSTHHLIALLTLRWSSQPYTPNLTTKDFRNEVDTLLSLTYNSTNIIRTLFTEEANAAFDAHDGNSTNAREILALVLSDVYEELWANWRILYQSGDEEGIARRVESRVVYCVNALADAHPDVYGWAKWVCGKEREGKEGGEVGVWLPDSPPRIRDGAGGVRVGPGAADFGGDGLVGRESGVISRSCGPSGERFKWRKRRLDDGDDAEVGVQVQRKKQRRAGSRTEKCNVQKAGEKSLAIGDVGACESKHLRFRRCAAYSVGHDKVTKDDGDLDTDMG